VPILFDCFIGRDGRDGRLAREWRCGVVLGALWPRSAKGGMEMEGGGIHEDACIDVLRGWRSAEMYVLGYRNFEL
jgi:hypothetical protein